MGTVQVIFVEDRTIVHAWPEVTSVTWPEETMSGSMFCACTTFFTGSDKVTWPEEAMSGLTFFPYFPPYYFPVYFFFSYSPPPIFFRIFFYIFFPRTIFPYFFWNVGIYIIWIFLIMFYLEQRLQISKKKFLTVHVRHKRTRRCTYETTCIKEWKSYI